jgi:SRSO17 transposase
MTGASIETTLELWASSLRDAKAQIRPLFTQARVAASAGLFLDGLLGVERRKTGWMRAEAAGDPGPWRQQAILGRGRWEADALRDVVRDYALATLGDADAVLVIDETGFLKQGKSSCGVGRQYTGSAGKITNCQIGVFAAYVSCHGHAFIDRALYLPKAWTEDPPRLAAAHVPPGIGFATKPRLAGRMIERALAAEVPFGWVTADSVYGVGELEMLLRRAGKGYVLGVHATQPFSSWIGKPEVDGTAEEIAHELDPSAWRRLSAGEGTKGPRLHDWAYLELADLDAGEVGAESPGLWTRGLLIRRNIGDQSLAFFTTWCPAGTAVEALVAVEGRRWAIEDGFETAKNELGLDHNETRSWHGWHRHVSLVTLAFAMLARVRHHANQASPPKTTLPRLALARPPSSAGRSRKSAASPCASPNGASNPHPSSPGRSGGGRTKPTPSAHT